MLHDGHQATAMMHLERLKECADAATIITIELWTRSLTYGNLRKLTRSSY